MLLVHSRVTGPQSRVMAPWQGAEVRWHTSAAPKTCPGRAGGCGYNPKWSRTLINAQGKPPLINPLSELFHMTLYEFKIKKFLNGRLAAHMSSQALGTPEAKISIFWKLVYYNQDLDAICKYLFVFQSTRLKTSDM